MNLQNTYAEEERKIDRAKNATGDLLDIIKRLDDMIEEWKEASDCDSSDELRKKLEELEKAEP